MTRPHVFIYRGFFQNFGENEFKYGREKVQWNEDWINDTRPSIGVPQELLLTSPSFIGVVGEIFNSENPIYFVKYVIKFNVEFFR